jgi:hypothetical protein
MSESEENAPVRELGQYFTPRNLMIEMFAYIQLKKNLPINNNNISQ